MRTDPLVYRNDVRALAEECGRKLLAALGKAPMALTSVAHAQGVSAEEARRAMNRLVRSGLVRRAGTRGKAVIFTLDPSVTVRESRGTTIIVVERPGHRIEIVTPTRYASRKRG